MTILENCEIELREYFGNVGHDGLMLTVYDRDTMKAQTLNIPRKEAEKLILSYGLEIQESHLKEKANG